MLASSIWLLYLVNAFQSAILSSLIPFVTSDFESHSLLNVIYVVASAISAAVFIPLSKILDLWGRAEGFLIMASFATLGLVLMASDTPGYMEYKAPQGVSVSLSGSDEAEIHAAWDKLADGATVSQAYGPAPWGGQFGMLTDRFGVDWMFSGGEGNA